MIFIGGGAGLGPLWALLQYMDADIDRKVTFYYGARTAKDLLPGQDAGNFQALTNFRFVPALSEAGPEDE